MNTPTLHPADRLRRSGDGNIALGKMAHTICDEHERITSELGRQNADMWLEALCGLLGGMVEPVRRDDETEQLRDGWRGALATLNRIDEVLRAQLTGDTPDGLRDELEVKLGEPPNPALVTAHAAARRIEELRWAAVRAADAGDDDLPSTGCTTCATATSALVEIRDAAVLLGADAIDMMTPESEAAEVVALLRSLASERDESNARAAREAKTLGVVMGSVLNAARMLAEASGQDREDGIDILAAETVHRLNEARAEAADVRAMLDTETRQHEETSRELDAAHEEVERLRAGVAALRERPTRDELADYARRMRADDAPEADEPDDGWEPVLQWNVNEHGQRVVVNSSGHTVAWVDDYGDRPGCFRAGVLVDSLKSPWRSRDDCTDRSAAMRWCEQQPEVADVIAAYTSAPTVGATDAGPDAPALIVEGDGDTDALQGSAVPAAPVSTAEQRDGETGVDRPRVDSRERNEADR